MKDLKKQLQSLIKPNRFLNSYEYKEFQNLLSTGNLIKDESPERHLCVFFIPFNPKTQKILIVDHKKARQWIMPGGHMEKGELLEDAVKREAKEELGISIENVGKPFLFSVMEIQNKNQPCKVHYDTWFVVPAEKLSINLTEFFDTKWVTKGEAKKMIRHKTYLEALDRIPF